MQFLLDNLTASIIASTAVLIMLSMQMRATQQRILSTSRDVVQSRSRQLATWLEEDLGRIGRNMTGDERAFQSREEDDQRQWVTREFVFKRVQATTGQSGTADTIKTRYRLEPTSEKKEVFRKQGSEEISLYRFIREEKVIGASGGWEQKGGGIPGVEYFDVDLLDKDTKRISNPIGNEDKVHSVRIRFSLVGPYQADEAAYPVSRTNVVLASYPL